MDAFRLSQIADQLKDSGKAYLEFLRVPSLSMGLYALPAGGLDPQQPHTEDEVYYVAEGKGAITVGDESQPVGPGSVIFVKAGVPHRFHSITEDLQIIVLFAPAEYSQAAR